MKVCVPTKAPGGPDALLATPFEETDLLDYYELRADGSYEHLAQMRNCGGGACIEPVEAIRHRGAEGVLVHSLGPPALMRFHNYGIQVFEADAVTARQALELLAEGRLRAIRIEEVARPRDGKR